MATDYSQMMKAAAEMLGDTDLIETIIEIAQSEGITSDLFLELKENENA